MSKLLLGQTLSKKVTARILERSFIAKDAFMPIVLFLREPLAILEATFIL